LLAQDKHGEPALLMAVRHKRIMVLEEARRHKVEEIFAVLRCYIAYRADFIYTVTEA
jgi:hypothetical protein